MDEPPRIEGEDAMFSDQPAEPVNGPEVESATAPAPPASDEPTAGRGLSPSLRRLLVLGLFLASVVALGSLATIVAAHIDDHYSINHVSGAWVALSKYADEGVLYPPLYDGQRYGGTRFGPLGIVLNTAVARVTGEYLMSGKLVGAGATGVLLVVMFIAFRRLRCPTSVGLALLGATAVTTPCLISASSVRGDATPVVLQLAAIIIFSRSARGGPLVLAALLCAAAMLSKISAIWAVMAIGLWLLARDRRGLLLFAGSYLLLLAAGAAAFHFASGGRMIESLFGCSTAGLGGFGALAGMAVRSIRILLDHAIFAGALLPLGVLGVLLAAAWRRLTIFHLSFVMSAIVLFVVLADKGAGSNHLIDLIVLTAICIADLWHRLAVDDERMSLAQATVAILIIWTIGAGWFTNLRIDLRRTCGELVRGEPNPWFDRRPLASSIGPEETLLSEDPYVPVSLGQLPVVLDAWMLRHMEPAHPEWIGALADRVAGREFDKIVLLKRTNKTPQGSRGSHFVPAIAAAIAEHYRFSEELSGYDLWLPAEEPALPEAPEG